MDDRTNLTQACLDSPQDRLPRLILADWYADHPDFPGAAANEAFLRACWGGKEVKGTVMPRKAYAVLRERWLDLIPSVIALSVKVVEVSERFPEPWEDGFWHKQVSGTRFQLCVNLPGRLRDGEVRIYPCKLKLSFWMGLASEWSMPSQFGRERVAPALRADRPELFLTPETKS